METKANFVAVGAFVLICMLGLVVTLLWLAGAQYSQEYVYYQTSFKGPVTGLGDGTTVRYNGIDVGRVTELKFDPNDPQRVIVKLQTKPDLHIRKDSEATIESEGLTGGSYVEISAAPRHPTSSCRPRRARFRSSDRANRPCSNWRRARRSCSRSSTPPPTSSTIFSILRTARRSATSWAISTRRRRCSPNGRGISTRCWPISRSRPGTWPKRRTRSGPRLPTPTRACASSASSPTTPTRSSTARGPAQLADLLREARGLVASLTRFSNALDQQPTKLLFGDRQKGYTPK